MATSLSATEMTYRTIYCILMMQSVYDWKLLARSGVGWDEFPFGEMNVQIGPRTIIVTITIYTKLQTTTNNCM